MPAADDIIEHAAEFLRRISPEGRASARRRRERRKQAARKIAKRVFIAAVLILAAAIVAGFVIGPIGIEGVFAVIFAIMLAATAIVMTAHTPQLSPAKIVEADIAQLPARTEDWLETQRPALPAPAQRQLDALGLSLEALAPQLATLDARTPEALEVRRLIGDELPELINGYRKVPTSLRRQPLDGGPSPDRQLSDGLRTIDEEIARMNARLASADLKALATQNRYLEIKYKGDGDIGGER